MKSPRWAIHRLFMSLIGASSFLAYGASGVVASDNLTPVACKFEHLPLMLLIFRSGMGGNDNTVQIGQQEPVPLSVGSSLMTATFQGQEFVFSLRMPANVSVSGQGSDTMTYHGDCVSSPPR
jgi:hypothetical protein